MKKAVVTGAGGFLGSALTHSLCARGYEVTAVSHRDVQGLPCTAHACDIRTPNALTPWLCEDSILFHCAGHTSVSGSVREPRKDFEANVIGFLNALESARETGARVVFPSSAAVFAPEQQLPLSEGHLKGPVSPYGAAKLACETYAQTFSRCYGTDVRIARLFNVYGIGMTRFVIFDFYQKLKQDPTKLEMLGDGNQMRDYLYIDDAVAALMLIAETGSPGEDYNVGSGVPTLINELAGAVASTMGLHDIEISSLGRTFPGDIARWLADITKLQEMGFRQTVDLPDGLQKTIEWFGQQSLVAPEREVPC